MKREEKLKWYKNEFEKIAEEIDNKGCLSLFDFYRIRNFKLQNSTTENEENIKKITSDAFQYAQEDNIIQAIETLVNLEGVAIPISSTILAMRFPDKFAIIDRRVIIQLDKKEWLKKYLSDPKIYEEYIILMRKLSKEKKISLRDLERQMFEGKIT